MRKATGTTRLIALFLLLSATACGDSGEEAGPIDLAAVSTNLQGTAPDVFRARFETSKGDFVVEVTRAWSPAGADRFYNLVSHGYLDGVRFIRVIEGFMVQFGINGNPDLAALLREANIPDDPVVESNARGKVTFAKTGLPNSRSTQIFINLVDNVRLDHNYTIIGTVVSGMDIVDAALEGATIERVTIEPGTPR